MQQRVGVSTPPLAVAPVQPLGQDCETLTRSLIILRATATGRQKTSYWPSVCVAFHSSLRTINSGDRHHTSTMPFLWRCPVVALLAIAAACTATVPNTTTVFSTVEPSTEEMTTVKPITVENFAAADGALSYHVRTDTSHMTSIAVQVNGSASVRYITPDGTGSATEALNLGFALGMGKDGGRKDEPSIGGEARNPLILTKEGNLVLETRGHGTWRMFQSSRV